MEKDSKITNESLHKQTEVNYSPQKLSFINSPNFNNELNEKLSRRRETFDAYSSLDFEKLIENKSRRLSVIDKKAYEFKNKEDKPKYHTLGKETETSDGVNYEANANTLLTHNDNDNENDDDDNENNLNTLNEEEEVDIPEINDLTLDEKIKYYNKIIGINANNSSASVFGRNILKNIVSKNKIRFNQQGFDLDLTYITDRIIAMGFPADNYEKIYRNSLAETLRFFESRHKENYRVYNLCSERSYLPNTFYSQAYFPFDDHEAPPLNILIPFCFDVKSWLDANESNVVAVHCKAGKGRTGTMLCCYLLFINFFNNSEKALKFFGAMRTINGKGVTIPSQIRYVHYFEKLLRLFNINNFAKLYQQTMLSSGNKAFNAKRMSKDLILNSNNSIIKIETNLNEQNFFLNTNQTNNIDDTGRKADKRKYSIYQINTQDKESPEKNKQKRISNISNARSPDEMGNENEKKAEKSEEIQIHENNYFVGYDIKINFDIIAPIVSLKLIVFNSLPLYGNITTSCTPYFKVYNYSKKDIYNFKKHDKKKTFYTGDNIEFPVKNLKLKGDVKIIFFNKNLLGKEKMFKFSFNTFFIPNDGAVSFNKKELDKACKDKEHKVFKENFKIDLFFNIQPEQVEKKEEFIKIFNCDF